MRFMAPEGLRSQRHLDPSPRHEQQATASNRISSFLLFATVAVAPLPFGSTDRPAIALLCIALGLSLVLSSTGPLSGRRAVPLMILMLVVAAYFLVLSGQLWSWLPIAPDPVWEQASRLLGAPLKPSVTVVRDEPFFALGAPLAAALAFAAAYLICTDRLRANQLLRVLAWSGAVYAVLGIVLFMADPTKVLWRDKVAYGSSLTATFINRNTAAVYFGSCAVVCLLLLLHQFEHEVRGVSSALRRKIITSAIIRPRRDLAEPFVQLLLCCCAMFMAGSRAGVVFSLVGLVSAYLLFYQRNWGRGRSFALVALAAAVLAVALLQVFGGEVENRFNEFGVSDPARLGTYKSTLQMVSAHPWLGTGLGSFEYSFPAYRSDDVSIWGVWTRAHSTLLEIATEMGVPLALLVATAWVCALWWLWRGIQLRRRDLIIPISALCVAIVGLLHSAIDFSLQIPGYAIPMIALIGAGLAQSFRTKTGRAPPSLG
jgi:O-antigen ligase